MGKIRVFWVRVCVLTGMGSSTDFSLFRVSGLNRGRNKGYGLNSGRVFGSTGLICRALYITKYKIIIDLRYPE